MITNFKIIIISCLVFSACASQVKLHDVAGTYEGNHLMLYKKLTLKPDSTYIYTIEGDLYPYPIKQEGYWELKNGKVKLNANHDYKTINFTVVDSLKEGKLDFYFFNSMGNPINDFAGNVMAGNDTYPMHKIQDNLYEVVLYNIPNAITINNTNDLYEDFILNLKGNNGNTINVYLFMKNEIQKNKWSFKFKDKTLHQKKGFKYEKISH